SKCTCPSMNPGAMMRPLSSCVSRAAVKRPRGWTLAIIAPTMPMSASRSSSVATSTTRPPVKRRANGLFPRPAGMAASRVDRSMGSFMSASADEVLLGFDVRGFDDRGIFFDLLRQERSELGGAVADKAQARLGQLGAHVGLLQRGDNRLMQ